MRCLTRQFLLTSSALCFALSATTVSQAGIVVTSVEPVIEARNPDAPHGIAPAARIARLGAVAGWGQASDLHQERVGDAVLFIAPPTSGVDDATLSAALPDALDAALADDLVSEREHAWLSEFYASREFAPAWVVNGRLGEVGAETVNRLLEARFDGLDPDDYPVPQSDLGRSERMTPEALAAAEVAVSVSVVRYARDARGARISPSDVSEYVDIRLNLPNALDVLEAISSADNPAGMLASYHPRHAGYERLRERLVAFLTDGPPANDQIVIPDGQLLKPGMSDDRVPDLRERLGLEPAQGASDTSYSGDVVAAVEAFQEENGLTVDGVIGPSTLSVMNGDRALTVSDLIVNMERWRWLPGDLGRHHVFVNIPEYELDIMVDGESVFDTRVIVGTIKTQTPVFSDEIEHLVVNPSWNVPVSIARRSLLPAAQRDPNYLANRDFQVFMRIGGQYHAVDPTSVNWETVSAGDVRIRQRPGRGNALGNIKFMFPNRHAVYLHDTNSRGLFRSVARAMSNGCVRVENPLDFSEALLKYDPQWNAEKVRRHIGGGETYMNLDSHVPVHLAYFTATVDADGATRAFNDVYGHDRRMKRLLGLD